MKEEEQNTRLKFLVILICRILYSVLLPVVQQEPTDPKLKDQKCYGWNIYGTDSNGTITELQLKWLLLAYKLFPDKEKFFIHPKKFNPNPQDFYFNKLAGNSELMQQIIEEKSEAEIRASWQPKLEEFKKIRKKYLLYPDF